MSEPPTFDPEYPPDIEDADKTQPSAEILNALENLTPTVPNSQEISAPTQDAPPVPTSEWDTLRAQLHENRYDPSGWNKLVNLAEASGEIDKIKESYDALLEVYPNTSSAQIAYLEHFLNLGSFQFAEGLFKQFLRTSPSVDLWRFYLTYVRRVNVGPATRDTVRQSYEFALNHVGQDKESGDIWSEYIQFLKSGDTSSTWEEQQKMDALRKVYHRAVQIPLDNVERLWSDLETFETNLNKITAKKFMADLSPSKVQAVTVLRYLQKNTPNLFPPPGTPGIWLPALPKFEPPERALVGQWKTYLKYEEGNPLEIEEKDRTTLITRVQGVYRKALIRMRFYPEIWYMAYVWTNSVGKHDEAVSIIKAGIEANPCSFVLNFAYAELLEAKKENTEVHAIFEKLILNLQKELDALDARVNSRNSSFATDGKAQPQPANGNGNGNGITTEAGIHSNNSSFDTQTSDDKPTKSEEIAERRTEFGLVWIVYMRFARRAESLKSSRAVFSKSRKGRWTPWEVYEAAALMEYHVTKATDVASRIFEKGMETYGEEIDYVLRYLGFLISVNDNNNARALFERVIPNFDAKAARPLWERWARYEYQYGDLEASQKLEKRMAEVYPTDPPIKRFAQRHSYLNTDAIAARDLGFAMVRAGSSSPNWLGRTETQQSLMAQLVPPVTPLSNKRPVSPDNRKQREPDYPHKRSRPLSPGPRDRERWDGPKRRYDSPGWDRERERDGPSSVPPRRIERDRDEDRGVVLPSVIHQFVGMLPPSKGFDGPVFRTEDMLTLFRNAVIPSTSARPRSPPPPPRGAGRPPPDYGPYQGPGGGRAGGGRRY